MPVTFLIALTLVPNMQNRAMKTVIWPVVLMRCGVGGDVGLVEVALASGALVEQGLGDVLDVVADL